MVTIAKSLVVRRSLMLCALTAPLLLAGCANQAVTQSGFLGDYDGLAPATPGAKALTYSRGIGQAGASGRRSVLIDAVELRLPAEQADAISPALQLQAKADYRVALQSAFSAHYDVVESTSDLTDLLRVRAAITGLKPSNPTLNTLTFLLVGPVSNGGVSTEAEVLDAATGERVAAQATFTNGHLFNGGMGGFFDPLGHVRKAFDSHAQKLLDLTLPGPQEAVAAAGPAAAQSTGRSSPRAVPGTQQ